MGNPTGEIKSVHTLFAIIQRLHEKQEAGVTELAREIGLSKSAVHKHLKTMESHGYVKCEGGRYSLDILFLTYGGGARNRSKICRAADDEILHLSEDTNELISFAVRNRDHSIYTHIQNDGYNLRNFVPLGTRLLLHQTAAGKAILAALPESEISAIMGGTLPAKTDHTIQNVARLKDELQLVQKRGFAISNEESLDGVISIASNIEYGSEVGAISISLPAKERTPDDVITGFKRTVIDAASRIELRAKYENKDTKQHP